ncbi:MAG TPA: NAD(P)H-binding protein [Thermoanaerobaculia bacterium]|nr:NAD(P)H-binding protein [Thermoanaerobaculia bacterium]
MANVFITGGTGYIGSRLIPELLRRGHTVRALVRNGSIAKLPQGAEPVVGNALELDTFARQVAPSDTFVQLIGVPHPSPAKAQQFRDVDLVSVTASAAAARNAGVRHFVYLSVAQPAPVMRDYVAVRAEGERLVRETGIAATFVRPWYVLGPGHRWPYLILPLYWLWGLSPKSRDTARRLYPVKLHSVIDAIAGAVGAPPDGVRVIEAPELRSRA